MIDQALRPVIQLKSKSAAYGSGKDYFAPQSDGHSRNSWLQPAGARGPDRTVGGAILKSSRKAAEQMRHGNQAADPGRTHVALRIHHFRNHAQMVQSRM